MPYFVRRQTPPHEQLTFEEIMLGIPSDKPSKAHRGDATGTITRVRIPTPEDIKRADIPYLIDILDSFYGRHHNLYDKPRQELYRTFYIPKHSGGLRKIDAPNDELMAALRELKVIFEKHFGALYHTSAFAYVSGRCPVDAVKRHQMNESKWFLKTDFSNFFGTTTQDFIEESFKQIFPFSEVMKYLPGSRAISRAIDLCLLNGGLPQGTPISPMLTNLIMIPIDHAIFNKLAEKHFVYTRYADDMLISCKQNFDPKAIQDLINEVLKEHKAPYTIKKEKTRYASSSGSNWNLGVMLNKENEITVGYQKKKQFKAMVNAFILDTKNNVPWPLDDVKHMDGLLSYYKMVEPEYFKHLIESYNAKYGVDFKLMVKLAQGG